jgi:hypothetical protein
MRSPNKVTAVVAAVAVMAPVGIAQPTHESGKAGAPGQVCKSLRVAKKEALKHARQHRVPVAERRALAKTFREGYKGCVKGAAEARSADKPQEQPSDQQ